MTKPRELGKSAKGILEDVEQIASKTQPEYLKVAGLIIAGKYEEAASKLESMADNNNVVSKALFLLLADCHEDAKNVLAAYKREYRK